MEDRRLVNGYYNYTVVLTYLGMLSGFTGIIFAMGLRHKLAIICLMVAGLCDMFDGTIAATKKRDAREKNFGIQIDSLSDLICFGVLPAIILYGLSGNNLWVCAVGGIYALCALIRLAYFNVCEEERQKKESDSRKYYEGLPVTSAALIIPVAFLVRKAMNIQGSWFMIVILLVMSMAFISTFKLKKPHDTGKLFIGAAGIALFAAMILL